EGVRCPAVEGAADRRGGFRGDDFGSRDSAASPASVAVVVPKRTRCTIGVYHSTTARWRRSVRQTPEASVQITATTGAWRWWPRTKALVALYGCARVLRGCARIHACAYAWECSASWGSEHEKVRPVVGKNGGVDEELREADLAVRRLGTGEFGR